MRELQAQLNALGRFGTNPSVYDLSPGPAAPQANGRIITNPGSREAVLMMDVGTAEPGQAYGLYVVDQSGALVPVTDVEADDQGEAFKSFELDEPFENYESVHVKPRPVTDDESSDPTGDGITLDDALSLQNGGSIGSLDDDEVSP
jgi:hypothetical protein